MLQLQSMRVGGGGSSTRAAAADPRRRLLGAAALAYNLGGGAALDNGLRVPPMGWSSWYGFTSNIDEVMLRGMADGMVDSGLHKAGYQHIWIDDGWAVARSNASGSCGEYGPVAGGTDSCKVQVDAKLFPSGMANQC